MNLFAHLDAKYCIYVKIIPKIRAKNRFTNRLFLSRFMKLF